MPAPLAVVQVGFGVILGRGIDNLLRHLSISLYNNLLDVLRGLDRLGLVVDPLKLLEGSALGLDAEVDIMLALMP
jgi:hypothetical protein